MHDAATAHARGEASLAGRPPCARTDANYFAYDTAAARYAAGRPYFHPVVVDRIRRMLKKRKPIPWALDAGCGTGQSSAALLEIAARVAGVDSSMAMLERACRDERISYVNARAEALPFRDGVFGLATASCGFHWFERQPFLAEARRVLAARGWLVLYNNAFQARMRENGDFWSAFRRLYAKRYPTPIRKWRALAPAEAEAAGFEYRHQDRYANEVALTLAGLAEYLLTQTNMIAAVEGRGESLEGARAWIMETFAPFFKGPTGTFEFGGLIWYLRKA